MATAIIGVGNIGRAVAHHLVAGGESVVLAAREVPDSAAQELGTLARATTVGEAISQADAVILAVWFDTMKDIIDEHRSILGDKVVIDTSNPVAADASGQFNRTLPDGVSAGSLVAGLLPASAHFVKGFGTLSAQSLTSAANRTPRRAVLFYATDDEQAGRSIEQLILTAGFEPVRAGGVDAAIRIEMYGDLHEFGGLNGRVVDSEEARAAVAADER